MKVAGMARSTYYYNRKALSAPVRHESARKALKDLHKRHRGRYGYRRMTAALRQQGIVLNHKTVRKLMREEGIECKIRRKRKYNRVSAEMDTSPNLLNRRFTSEAPFIKAVTDVTEFNLGAQKIYVSALIDLYDGAVMSLAMSTSNDTELVMSMFDGISQSDLAKLKMIHSDQGVLYRTYRYHDYMAFWQIQQSMSRRGNCYDNAVVESFFGTFKCETVKLYQIRSKEELAKELVEYVRYYNEERLKSTLGYKSPMQYRQLNGF